MRLPLFSSKQYITKQFRLDSVFVISGIIKISVSVISLSLRLRLITLTSTLVIPDITKTSSNNRSRSIYQYSNMGPRLSGLTSIFGVVFFVSKSPVGIERQKKLEKFAIFTRKPRSHA